MRLLGWVIVTINAAMLVAHEFGGWPIHPWFAVVLIASYGSSCYFRGRTDELMDDIKRMRRTFEPKGDEK
jgi:hypothetical protein